VIQSENEAIIDQNSDIYRLLFFFITCIALVTACNEPDDSARSLDGTLANLRPTLSLEAVTVTPAGPAQSSGSNEASQTRTGIQITRPATFTGEPRSESLPKPATPAVNQAQPERSTDEYLLLHFERIPVEPRVIADLEAAGVVLFDYLPPDKYYARIPPGAQPTLQELLYVGSLKEVGPVPAESKLDTKLAAKLVPSSPAQLAIIVQFFEEISATDQEKLEDLMEVQAYSFGPVNFAEGTVLSTDIEKIVSLSFVKKVEEQTTKQLF
jgi:hypothetical protein